MQRGGQSSWPISIELLHLVFYESFNRRQVLNVKPPNEVYIHNILTGMVQYLSIQAKADIEEGPNIEQSSQRHRKSVKPDVIQEKTKSLVNTLFEKLYLIKF